MKRVPQPPVNPALRDVERHDFWPGFVAVVAGVVLLFCGARHLTGVGTVAGNTATEIQLVKAFASGGLQYANELAPPPPPKLDGPGRRSRGAGSLGQTTGERDAANVESPGGHRRRQRPVRPD